MKALFVSDNHGDRAILQKIAARFSNEVDIMLHCGDSNLEPSDPVMQPFKTVIGLSAVSVGSRRSRTNFGRAWSSLSSQFYLDATNAAG